MEFTQLVGVGLGLALGLNLHYSHLVSMKTQPHMHMQQSTITGEFLEIPVLGRGLICTKITRMMGNFTNETGNGPGQLRCLKGHLRRVNLTEIDAIHDNE